MSAFIDHMAEESEGESSGSEVAEPRAKKPKKTKKRHRISSDEEEEEEDEDEARMQEEMKDFIVDQPEEDEKSEGEEDKESEKSDEFGELSEEDLDVINENLGTKVHGGRVQLSEDEDEDVRERIEKDLFDRGGGESPEAEERAPYEEREDDESRSESDMSEDPFIVQDDSTQHQKRRRKTHIGGISEHVVDEAREVFGVDEFNIDEFYEEDEEEEELEGDEELLEEEEGEEGMTERRRPKVRSKKETLMSSIEPSELDKGFVGASDKRILFEDKPERFQLRKIPVTDADADEINTEAKWIYDYCFNNSTITTQRGVGLSYTWPGNKENHEINTSRAEEEAPEKIKEALVCIRKQIFEVPFIAFYRKEYVSPWLNVPDLWKVYEYDEKWCLLQSRKTKLKSLMERMQTYMRECGSEQVEKMRKITPKDEMNVDGIKNMEELADVSANFHLYYGHEISRMIEWEQVLEMRLGGEEQTRFKMSGRTDKYQLCVQCGLGGLAERFGLTAEQYAENLSWFKHDVVQDSVAPLDAAKEYISENFPTSEEALKGATYMVAIELSRQPAVRDKLRRMYKDALSISVKATKKGREMIDEGHPIYSMKYLKLKPAKEFKDDDYLLLVKAQSEGLVELKFHVEEPSSIPKILDPFGQQPSVTTKLTYDDFIQVYHRDEFHFIAEEWNKEGREFILRECAINMHNRIQYAPYQKKSNYPEEEDEDEVDHPGTRIMAICYSTDFLESAFGCIIDQNGVMFAHIRLVHLLKRAGEYGDSGNFRREAKENAELKKKDLRELNEFILKHKPHVIALGAESFDVLRIREDIQKSLMEIMSSRELQFNLPVEIIDNEAAKVYMNSHMSMQEFQQYPPYLRQAVSLARLLLDPLVEYCHLCNADNDILFCKFHPLQDQVPQKDLLNAIQIECINRVNEVGVDINHCMEFPHTASVLQFVCGLGPRKAAHLIKLLKQNDSLLESRTKLVTMCRMGPKVFMNCAGFIKIATDQIQEKTDAYVEVLDSSRVHPETYEWARKMAVDALEADDNADPTGALEEILNAPEKLKDLDLDAFADELERQGFGKKNDTLYDIRAELTQRYRECREEYKRLNEDALFNLVTRDMLSDFKPGRLLCGKVMRVVNRPPRQQEINSENNHDYFEVVEGARPEDRRWKCKFCGRDDFTEAYQISSSHWAFELRNGRLVCECPGQAIGIKIKFDNGVTGFVKKDNISDDPNFKDPECPGQAIGIKIKFDNGVTGFVKKDNISDDPNFKDPLERVKIDSPIYCRVLNVNFCLQATPPVNIDCTTKSSDLRNPSIVWKDSYYDDEQEMSDRAETERAKNAQNITTRFVKRVISHPSFHNVTCKDAERMLNNMELGEAIIRPSSLGVDFLTVTWKVAEDIYQHIVVREKGKKHYFNIGKVLYIGEESFEDLDEILARHIQPMAALAREVLSYKYYLDGVRAEEREKIETQLQTEKKRNPSRIPYIITTSFKYGGKFVISYMPNSRGKIIHEYFTLTPDGIRFRKRNFNGIEDMVNWFKVHFREIPQQPPHAVSRVSSQISQNDPLQLEEDLKSQLKITSSLSQILNDSQKSIQFSAPMFPPPPMIRKNNSTEFFLLK
uniref:Suppressor of Ty 6 homolog n=1 Tax=Acrobeloides nanus TaxID=290746 RepID=A0A914CC01_9BILA